MIGYKATGALLGFALAHPIVGLAYLGGTAASALYSYGFSSQQSSS